MHARAHVPVHSSGIWCVYTYIVVHACIHIHWSWTAGDREAHPAMRAKINWSEIPRRCSANSGRCRQVCPNKFGQICPTRANSGQKCPKLGPNRRFWSNHSWPKLAQIRRVWAGRCHVWASLPRWAQHRYRHRSRLDALQSCDAAAGGAKRNPHIFGRSRH